jgi:enterochelin esterase-like enzyme
MNTLRCKTGMLGAVLVLVWTGWAGCSGSGGSSDAGLDAQDAADASGQDGGDGVEPDGGDEGLLDGGDAGADRDFQVAHGSVHLAGTFNEWAPADPGFAFAPVADHLWGLETTFPEGLQRFKLTLEGVWDSSLGTAGEVAHHAARLTLAESGGDVPLVCLAAGRYRFEYRDLDRTLTVSGLDMPAPTAAGLDLDPRLIENRSLGAGLIDGVLSGEPAGGLALGDLMAHGGMPLRGGQLLHFFAALPGDGSEPIQLAGTYNGWDPGAGSMEPLAGLRLFYLALPAPAEGLTYKLVYQGQWFSDEWNRSVAWDGIPVAGVGDFNSIFPAPADQRAIGRLVRLRFQSVIMGDTRDVYVYLPVAYDLEPQRDFPLMVVHDGNESIARSQFDAVADAEIAAGRVAPVVLAFVALASQDERMDEYTFHTQGSQGELYRRFIADELVPFLQGEFRLVDDPQARAVMGASLGGLISYFIGWERSEVFGLVAGMSSSFFWDESWMVHEIEADSGPLKPLRFYLDSADVNDNHDETVQVAQALAARGYAYRHVVQAGASHDWFFWKQRFGPMLQYLFPAR